MTKKPDLPGEPSALVVRRMPIDALQADPRNAMTHPEASVAAIESSLREFGQQKPIVVDQTGMIVAGHGTVEAAKRLGWTHVEAAISDLEGPKRDGYAIADNRTAQLAKWHDEQLAETLKQLGDAGVAHADLGFDDAALKKLLVGLSDATAGEIPPDNSRYKEQYGVIVMTADAAEQERVYNQLSGLGLSCKVVVT